MMKKSMRVKEMPQDGLGLVNDGMRRYDSTGMRKDLRHMSMDGRSMFSNGDMRYIPK